MIEVTDRINLGNTEYINLDARYTDPNGNPFSSVSAAQTYHAGKMNELFIGFTVLVKESGWTEAKEYWVQPKGTTPETYGLVEKGAGTTDYAALDNKPTINNVPLSGNKTASDLSLATAEQGGKADTAIQGVSVNGTEVTPDPTTKKVALTIENGKSAYQLYLDDYEDEHGSTDGALDEAAWLESLQGKSALQIYNETMNTSLDEAGFINVLKQNYPMEYVVYNQTAAEQSIGTAFAAIDQLPASDSTAGKLYLMPNDGITPTGTELFITVQTGATTYMWYRLGALSVPSNVLTEDKIVQDLNTGGADKVPSAAVVKELKEDLYGHNDDSVESETDYGSNLENLTATFVNLWITDGEGGVTRSTSGAKCVAMSTSLADIKQTYKKLHIIGNVNRNIASFGIFTKASLVGLENGSFRYNDLKDTFLCDGATSSNFVFRIPYKSESATGIVVEIPPDAEYLYLRTRDSSSTACTPSSVKPFSVKAAGDIEDVAEEVISKRIVDNCDSDNPEYVLSAKQGKQISERLSKLEQKIRLYPLWNTNHIGTESGTISSSGSVYKMWVQPIKNGEKLYLKAQCIDASILCYGFHTSYPYENVTISKTNIGGETGKSYSVEFVAESDGFFIFSCYASKWNLELFKDLTSESKNIVIGERTIGFTDPIESSSIAEAYGDIHDLYDALTTSHPNAFEKLDNILTDTENNNIICHYRLGYKDMGGLYTNYLFETSSANDYYEDSNEGGKSHETRKILFNAGVHGDEKTAVWGLYHFCRSVLESNAGWAEFIKSNYIIDIIPIVCTNNYELDRRSDTDNAASENLPQYNPNRNFGLRTIAAVDAIASYIDQHYAEYRFHVDCHNHSNSNAGGKCFVSSLRNGSNFNEVLQFQTQYAGICKQNWDLLTNGEVVKWKKPNGSPVSDPKLVMQTNTESKIGAEYTMAFPAYTRCYGIHSLTMEAPRRLNNSSNIDTCNKDAAKLTADMLIALLLYLA